MKPFNIILIITFIITGSLANIIPKIEMETKSLGIRFQHTWIFLFFMFLNEILAFPIYYISNKNESKNNNLNIKNKKPECKFYHSIPSVIFDFLGAGINFLGLAILPASITQMLGSSQIIFTYILSKLLTNNKHNINHYIGITLTIIGIIIVGFSGNSNSNYSFSTNLMGIFCILIAMFFLSCQVIYEENLTKKYNCSVIKIIGFQGIFGSFFSFIMILILSNISCGMGKSDFLKEICSFDDNGLYYVENLSFALKQLKNSTLLIFLTFFYFIGDLFCNLTGIKIGQILSGMSRSILEPVKSVVVWFYFVLPFNYPQLREKFSIIQLVGFIILVFGNLIFHHIINIVEIINKYNLNKKKENINKKENDINNYIENLKLINEKGYNEEDKLLV